MEKKGNLIPIFIGLLIFGIVSVLLITAGYFYYAVGHDYIMLPLHNASTQTNYSQTIDSEFDDVVINYKNVNLKFIDNFWFFGYFVVILISFKVAYSSRTENYFGWLSMLTYGLMLMLFIAGLFSVLLNWWYNDILLRLFENLVIYLPKFGYYVNNYGWLFFLHACALLFINKVDFNIARIRQRKQKEQATMEDDEIV